MDRYFTADGAIRKQFYLLYWAAYTLLFTLLQSIPSEDFPKPFYNEVISLPPRMLFVHLTTGWLMDRYFFRGDRARFFAGYVVLLLVFAFVLRLTDNYLILPYVLTDWTK